MSALKMFPADVGAVTDSTRDGLNYRLTSVGRAMEEYFPRE